MFVTCEMKTNFYARKITKSISNSFISSLGVTLCFINLLLLLYNFSSLNFLLHFFKNGILRGKLFLFISKFHLIFSSISVQEVFVLIVIAIYPSSFITIFIGNSKKNCNYFFSKTTFHRLLLFWHFEKKSKYLRLGHFSILTSYLI